MQPRVFAILLAAGKSSRMGCCKQLLPLGDRPVIVHCLSSIISAGISDIVVVLGTRHEQLLAVVRDFPVTIVHNRDPESDMSASVKAGMGALFLPATCVLVCLSDHPLVSPDTFRSLLLRHVEEPDKILIPVHQGKKGHPTLFPHSLLGELNMRPTLRDIVRFDPGRVLLLDTADRGVTLDMDTPEDYRKIKSLKLRGGNQNEKECDPYRTNTAVGLSSDKG